MRAEARRFFAAISSRRDLTFLSPREATSSCLDFESIIFESVAERLRPVSTRRASCGRARRFFRMAVERRDFSVVTAAISAVTFLSALLRARSSASSWEIVSDIESSLRSAAMRRSSLVSRATSRPASLLASRSRARRSLAASTRRRMLFWRSVYCESDSVTP